ncbi:MAG: aminotransferase class I/II-fold pyridoxal phosphate-dependent enzyme [Phycisphaerales bacterium]|nr:MAG: aminotransferase class I/II-fold pyridoxal phosphate-dependent enzyme [Phycisphaerales bacterium]
MDAERFIAEHIRPIGVSGIRKIFDLAATMTSPIDLSIGQPDFAPPESARTAAIDAIQSGKNGYTPTPGLPALRERIRQELQEEFGWEPEVAVHCGVSGGLTLALLACLNPGDEVVFADPYFVSYTHLVRLAGGVPITVDVYPDFRLHPDRFANALTPKTKAILLNSPGNPTGVVHAAGDVEAVCALADERDLLVISDEIYNKLVYDGTSPSPVTYAPDRTLLLRGFGKSYGMTGWRMGYSAGPAAVVQEMTKLQQYTFVCAPQPFQWACVAAMDADVSPHVTDYRRKRDIVSEELDGVFEFVRPSGGFYVFPRIPSGYATATEFVSAAIRREVLIIPGSVFSAHDTHFRISYAAPDERLRAGCRILRELAR